MHFFSDYLNIGNFGGLVCETQSLKFVNLDGLYHFRDKRYKGARYCKAERYQPKRAKAQLLGKVKQLRRSDKEESETQSQQTGLDDGTFLVIGAEPAADR